MVEGNGGMRMESERSPVEAVTQLFQLYADDVFRYARWMLGNQSEAEDVTQDVFIKALQAWTSFRGESTSKTWLLSIARHAVADEIRNKSRMRQLFQTLHRNHSEAVHTEPLKMADIKLDLLSLSLPHRQVILLRLVHQLTSKEAAEVLGWSEAKVRTTLHRATKKLRDSLSIGQFETVGGNVHE